MPTAKFGGEPITSPLALTSFAWSSTEPATVPACGTPFTFATSDCEIEGVFCQLLSSRNPATPVTMPSMPAYELDSSSSAAFFIVSVTTNAPLTIATPRTIASAVRTPRIFRQARPLRATRLMSRCTSPSVSRISCCEAPASSRTITAVREEEDAVCDRGRAWVVRDHHGGLAARLHRVAQELEDLAARRGVEVARRLVREEDGRARDERPRDRDALLLAAGELRRAVLPAVRQADVREELSSHCLSGFTPAIASGRVTFSSAFSIGRRLKNWKTKPMCTGAASSGRCRPAT